MNPMSNHALSLALTPEEAARWTADGSIAFPAPKPVVPPMQPRSTRRTGEVGRIAQAIAGMLIDEERFVPCTDPRRSRLLAYKAARGAGMKVNVHMIPTGLTVRRFH